MNVDPNYEAIGNTFVQHYYSRFDVPDPTARATGLSDLYHPEVSIMTFEGVQLRGRDAILQKFASITFGTVQREVTKVDVQPLPDGSIAVLILGQIKLDNDPVQSFCQMFVLGVVSGTFFVSNEMFRLVLHNN